MKNKLLVMLAGLIGFIYSVVMYMQICKLNLLYNRRIKKNDVSVLEELNKVDVNIFSAWADKLSGTIYSILLKMVMDPNYMDTQSQHPYTIKEQIRVPYSITSNNRVKIMASQSFKPDEQHRENANLLETLELAGKKLKDLAAKNDKTDEERVAELIKKMKDKGYNVTKENIFEPKSYDEKVKEQVDGTANDGYGVVSKIVDGYGNEADIQLDGYGNEKPASGFIKYGEQQIDDKNLNNELVNPGNAIISGNVYNIIHSADPGISINDSGLNIALFGQL